MIKVVVQAINSTTDDGNDPEWPRLRQARRRVRFVVPGHIQTRLVRVGFFCADFPIESLIGTGLWNTGQYKPWLS